MSVEGFTNFTLVSHSGKSNAATVENVVEEARSSLFP